MVQARETAAAERQEAEAADAAVALAKEEVCCDSRTHAITAVLPQLSCVWNFASPCGTCMWMRVAHSWADELSLDKLRLVGMAHPSVKFAGLAQKLGQL